MPQSQASEIDNIDTLPIGPLAVEPEQWSQGARIAICHPERGVIAVIEPMNPEDEPTMETAEREPWDESYARLFAAAPELLDEIKMLLAFQKKGGSLRLTDSWIEETQRMIDQIEGEAA